VTYRVIDEHRTEGRRAAQDRSITPRDRFRSRQLACGRSPGIKIATESLQEMIAQGVRFYASLDAVVRPVSSIRSAGPLCIKSFS